MARPEEVDHGHLLHKTVLVYPERVDCEFYRLRAEHFGDEPCKLTDAEIVAEMAAHCLERGGYKSGDKAKVVMVSRLSDCGLTKDLKAQFGYNLRVPPECLEVVE